MRHWPLQLLLLLVLLLLLSTATTTTTAAAAAGSTSWLVSLLFGGDPSTAAGAAVAVENDDDATSPLSSLFRRLTLDDRAAMEIKPEELVVGNVSAHRLRYERNGGEADAAERSLLRSLFGRAWSSLEMAATATTRPATASATRMASVVVTWDDHELAVQARPADKRLCTTTPDADTEDEDDDDNAKMATCTIPTAASSSAASPARDITYEMQMWVNGWGFDALWHPANRRVTTRDPFVVLHDDTIPRDHELSFRVRMRVRAHAGLLSGLFASEVDGPWSPTATLSPSTEHPIDALWGFVAANRMLGAVLTLCIGLSVVIIARLVARYCMESLRSSRRISRATSNPEDLAFPSARRQRQCGQEDEQGAWISVTDEDVDQETTDLHQELQNLRQELADSEAEVRRLMLFRGYGIESLEPAALAELAAELERALRLVQQQHRKTQCASVATNEPFFESLDETEEEDEDDPSAVSEGQDDLGGVATVDKLPALKTIDEADPSHETVHMEG